MGGTSCCEFCKNFILHILYAASAVFGVIFFGLGIYMLVMYDSYNLNSMRQWSLVWGMVLMTGGLIVLFSGFSICSLCTWGKKARGTALTLIVILNMVLLLIVLASLVTQLFFKSEVSETLAEQMLENPNEPDWQELGETFECCNVKIDANTTVQELECCAKDVFEKYQLKPLFTFIELIILIVAVAITICYCQSARKVESGERMKRKYEREERKMKDMQNQLKEERRKLHEEAKQNKLKGEEEVRLTKQQLKEEKRLKKQQEKLRKKQKNLEEERKISSQQHDSSMWDKLKFWRTSSSEKKNAADEKTQDKSAAEPLFAS